VRLIAAA